jgi:hypothetical protein
VSKQQVLGGCLLSVVAIGIAVPLAILATYDFVTRTRANALAWVFIGAVAAGIGIVAWATQRSYRWRGLAQGLWIGLGIAILLEGLCFLTMLR